MAGNVPTARSARRRTSRRRIARGSAGARPRSGAFLVPMSTSLCRALLKLTVAEGKRTPNTDLLKSVWSPHIGGASSTLVIRLPFTILQVASNVGAIIAFSFGASLSQLSDYVSIQAMFSGWRPKRGEIHYTPYFRGGSTNTGAIAAGLEFNTGTSAPGNISEALETENSQLFPLHESRSWKFDFTATRGELDWLDTAGSTTPPVSLKAYTVASSGTSISASYGAVWGWMDCEFRGIE